MPVRHVDIVTATAANISSPKEKLSADSRNIQSPVPTIIHPTNSQHHTWAIHALVSVVDCLYRVSSESSAAELLRTGRVTSAAAELLRTGYKILLFALFAAVINVHVAELLRTREH